MIVFKTKLTKKIWEKSVANSSKNTIEDNSKKKKVHEKNIFSTSEIVTKLRQLRKYVTLVWELDVYLGGRCLKMKNEEDAIVPENGTSVTEKFSIFWEGTKYIIKKKIF